MWQSIADQISETLHSQFVIHDKHILCRDPDAKRMIVRDGDRALFVKFSLRHELDRLECQQHCLEELLRYRTIRLPQPLCCGIAGDSAFLAMEYLPLHTGSADEWFELGCALAKLHQADIQQMYGWDEDNYLGHSPQPNRWQKQWSTFYAEQRIGWLLQLVSEKHQLELAIDEVVDIVKRRLTHHHPKPSPLHGNLQSANIGFGPGGPLLFDPASFFGDREVDLARLELDGNTPNAFFAGYNAIWPRDEGYQARRTLYQLGYQLQQYLEQGEPCRDAAEQGLRQLLAS